ncbi:MAG: circadian clock protein KaiC [Anaerolineae bacterium]|nr:circadian clock protein KaiC [Anaerolineae bacterium]NIQ78565.1 circadian clock protein KaiC [Anaerolineae bacterium]
MTTSKKGQSEVLFPKCLTGIQGLDEITQGGLPRGRPTLVCGSAGSGKTLLALEFLLRGALLYDEPGVFVSFEESDQELIQNVASLGWDLQELIEQKKMLIDHVYVERSEIEETGEYDLEGLFIRLGLAIDSIGAKRLALDTIGALFGGFTNTAILRAELRRLFRWLKDKGVTAIITGEPGETTLTRYGLEEYVSDCVIVLDHRIMEQVATRRLRVVKYRGSRHGSNEYPFLIGKQGISVLPITSMGLEYAVSTERISTGIPRLDTMLGGHGYCRGTSILVSGTAGTGKTSVAAHFADAACRRGERCLYFAFEEAMDQIIRNMRSIGIDLEPWVKRGLLQFQAARPTLYGLEMHLVRIHELIEEFKPHVVVVDPISNLAVVGTEDEARSMLARVIDFLKMNQITALFTDLTHGGSSLEATAVAVSSLMDTWIVLRDIESSGERNRGLYVLKSRGMAHSNQIREFLLTDEGIDLRDVYLGPGGVLTGTARHQQEAREQADALVRQQEIERKQRELERKRQVMEAQIVALRADFEAEEEEIKRIIAQDQLRGQVLTADRAEMALMRGADKPPSE